jgi:hypothetical protein
MQTVVRHFKMQLTKIITAILFLMVIISCGRIERKGDQMIEKTREKVTQTKQKIVHKKDQLIDKAFAPSDFGKPDTERDKNRFREYLKIDLTKDIRNIYTYEDYFGADYKILMSFSCDDSTALKIVRSKRLQLSTEEHDSGLFFGEEFPWWNKEAIQKLRPFKEGKELEYWKYFWFDKKARTGYYEEFSL